MKTLLLVSLLLIAGGIITLIWGETQAGIIGLMLCLIGLLGVAAVGILKTLR